VIVGGLRAVGLQAPETATTGDTEEHRGKGSASVLIRWSTIVLVDDVISQR
jgi:hypothetical protein